MDLLPFPDLGDESVVDAVVFSENSVGFLDHAFLDENLALSELKSKDEALLLPDDLGFPSPKKPAKEEKQKKRGARGKKKGKGSGQKGQRRGKYKKKIECDVVPASQLVPKDGKVRIGIYEVGEERSQRLNAYRERRKKRINAKDRLKYSFRQDLCKHRVRSGGRFVKDHEERSESRAAKSESSMKKLDEALKEMSSSDSSVSLDSPEFQKGKESASDASGWKVSQTVRERVASTATKIANRSACVGGTKRSSLNAGGYTFLL